MMRKLAKWSAVTGLAVAVLVAGGVAGLAQDKLAEIKARQNFMKAQGGDLKTILAFTKGTADQAAATKAIDDLLARAPKIATLFPAGTSATDFPGKTAAKPTIWTDWDKVKKIPLAVQNEEEKLKTAIASGDKKAVLGGVAALNKNGCGACHGSYRLKVS
jgi:cytochrome c556